jgi:hypothetical protein
MLLVVLRRPHDCRFDLDASGKQRNYNSQPFFLPLLEEKRERIEKECHFTQRLVIVEN